MEKASELEQKAHVKFPKHLTEDRLKEFFNYLARCGNYEIRYTKRMLGRADGSNFSSEETTEVSGSIKELPGFRSTADFDLDRDFDEDDNSYFSAMQFSSFGRDFHEIPKLEVFLWDNVRGCITSYFSQQKAH